MYAIEQLVVGKNRRANNQRGQYKKQ